MSSYAAAIRSVPWTVGQALLLFLIPWVVLPFGLIIDAELLSKFIPSLHGFLNALDSGDPTASFVLVLTDAIGSIALLGFFLRKHKVNWSALGLRPFSIARALLYVLILFISFGVLVVAADILVKLIYPAYNPAQAQTNEFTQAHSSISLWALVILPPLIEETVFRGFIFPAFAKRYGVIFGALISSILFAVAHLQLNVSVYTLVLGLLLCFLYVRLGSIIPGIGIHMLNNYIAYMAINQQ
ncbi:MAG TPA: type II CAAX endopeptidase family protein [Candidatus Polarisedimenticolaceae bacterium]|nr:type II CAAX endopeptidase family protein [Candidatus Polarisedimenticolaceae bacterium]